MLFRLLRPGRDGGLDSDGARGMQLEGYGKSLEEMSGGRGRIHGAGPVSNC